MANKKTRYRDGTVPDTERDDADRRIDSSSSSYHKVRGNSNRKTHMRNDAAMSLLNRAADAVNLEGIEVENVWSLLALMIVTRAVADWKKLGDRRYFHEYGRNIYREELIRFFRSKWCGMLMECTALTQEELINAVGIPAR